MTATQTVADAPPPPAKRPKSNGASAPPAEPEQEEEPKLSNAEELAALFPSPRTYTIAGRKVEIKPCGIAQAGRILDAGLPLYALHLKMGMELEEFLEDKPEETNALIVAATQFEPEWVAGLHALERQQIITAWLEVNGAFFFLRLLPERARLASVLASIGGGRTSSIS